VTAGDRSAGAADMIAVEAIGKTYGSGEHALEALVDVSFAVREGEFVTLVGPSGCGKSTLLQILAGLVPASTGRVVISGRPVTGPAPDTIGVMFQDAWLLPWKTAVENVEFPLALRKVPAAVRRTRALPLIDLVGLTSFAHRYPDELSGGMRQRVAIARAFVLQPSILLADEAFGHLDEVTAAELRETFLALARECGSTAILITHQLEEAIAVGDRIIVLGKSAKLLADIHVERWERSNYAVLREAIQSTLQSNVQDLRLVPG
jgi:NitT/TauT family transport system ATP-binding protein